MIFLPLAIWAVSVTSFPIAVAIWLIFYVVDLASSQRMLPAALCGVLTIDAHKIRGIRCEQRYAQVRFNYQTWLIWFELESGKRLLLWRDSVTEAEYRALLVMLKNQNSTFEHG